MSNEWAVELRPKTLDQMVGAEVNRDIIKNWLDNNNLPNAIIFYGKSGCGKALKNGTKVLTEAGYIPIEKLTIGTLVAGTDGNFHKVLGVYPQGVKSLYKLVFSNDKEIIASGDHIWTVSRGTDGFLQDITTKELYEALDDPEAIYLLPEVKPLKGLPDGTPRLFIVKIKRVEDGECTCIEVDSPDHLFVIEGGVPTHNTTASRIIAEATDAELIELDAASHNGVEDARQINELASRLSLTGRRKIFLIDECFPAGTLISTPQGEVEIEKLLPGNLVHNLTGTTTVQSIFSKQVKKKDLLKLAGFSSTYVTRNHLFLTLRGWYTAEQLAENPDVPIIQEKFHSEAFDFSRIMPPEVAFKRVRTSIRSIFSRFYSHSYQVGKLAGTVLSLYNEIRTEFDRNPLDVVTEVVTNYLLGNFDFFNDNRFRDIASRWKYQRVWHVDPSVSNTWYKTLTEMLYVLYHSDDIGPASFPEITAPFADRPDADEEITVYDLQVNGHPSYFADGYTVHNCHMLSTSAWNALLKAIEEPNPLVTFIFATTDYSKLPATIRGRSRMLKFYSVPFDQLKEYAQALLEFKGYTLKDEVLNLIVQQAHGQVRDLLKLLQTACETNLNDVNKITEYLAIPDSKGMRTFINGVLTTDKKAAVKVLSGINTDLLEWVKALKEHIYQLLEDKYGLREFQFGDDANLRRQVKGIEEKFTDLQFGKLLTALNKVSSPATAYAELYALIFAGV